ncbi:MAG: redox-sensing transcriptional repressor Rex, partial [Candidatus Omnitrophica bacterium]|nr:redox-sensing transcriptional repressor Rex [Candidatus Omnitrophota bacterium]
EGINIIAGFDIDPSKYSQHSNVPILAMDNIGEYIKEHSIKLAIIATPDIAAQQVLDIAVSSGVRGVLNFAPIRLKTKRDCVVSNVNLVLELETVIYFVNTLEKKRKI